YFDKVFGWNCIDSILRANASAYVGKPVWGKVATGQYRHMIDNVSQQPKARKRNERIRYSKEGVYPREPVFDPETFMPLDLWKRVQRKYKSRQAEDRSKFKTRDTAKHPLNGLLRCPDCGERMDISSS